MNRLRPSHVNGTKKAFRNSALQKALSSGRYGTRTNRVFLGKSSMFPGSAANGAANSGQTAHGSPCRGSGQTDRGGHDEMTRGDRIRGQAASAVTRQDGSLAPGRERPPDATISTLPGVWAVAWLHTSGRRRRQGRPVATLRRQKEARRRSRGPRSPRKRVRPPPSDRQNGCSSICAERPAPSSGKLGRLEQSGRYRAFRSYRVCLLFVVAVILATLP